MRLAEPSHDTLVLTHAALRGLTRIYQPEYRYQKAGVMLLNLMPAGQGQLSLFATTTIATEQRERLLDVMDRINRDMGRCPGTYPSGTGRQLAHATRHPVTGLYDALGGLARGHGAVMQRRVRTGELC